MTTRLHFDAAAVQRVVDHALRCGTNDVLLVKDQGVYLMSAGEPRDLIDGESSFVAYAKGMNPTVDPFDDWWDAARNAVGGDDFGEHLPWAREIKALLGQRRREIVIRVTSETLELET